MPLTPLPDDGDWFATTPISRPVIRPDAHIRDMGGFAWTEHGIQIGMGDAGSVWLSELRRMRFDPDEIGGGEADREGSAIRE